MYVDLIKEGTLGNNSGHLCYISKQILKPVFDRCFPPLLT